MDAPALRRAERPGFTDQRLEGLLADDREDHLAHDTFGTAGCCLDHTEQNASLAANLARLLNQLVDDAALSLDGDPVRHLDQQLHQAVHHLGLSRRAPEGQQGQTNALRVPAQLPGLEAWSGLSGRRDMPLRSRHRCRLDRASFGMLSREHPSTSSSGSNVRLRNSTIIASSTADSTVLRGTVGPMSASPVVVRARHLVTVVRLSR